MLNLASAYSGCSIKHINNKPHPHRTQYSYWKQSITDWAYLVESHLQCNQIEWTWVSLLRHSKVLASCWTSVHSFWSQATSGEWKKYISSTKRLFVSQKSCAIHTPLCSPNPFSVPPNAVFVGWTLWTFLTNEHQQNYAGHNRLWTIRPYLSQLSWSESRWIKDFCRNIIKECLCQSTRSSKLPINQDLRFNWWFQIWPSRTEKQQISRSTQPLQECLAFFPLGFL